MTIVILYKSDVRPHTALGLVEGRELVIYDAFADCTQKSPPGGLSPEGLTQEVLTVEDVCSGRSSHDPLLTHRRDARGLNHERRGCPSLS